jgi:hypothetical protein
MTGSRNILEFKRIKADFNKLSLEMRPRFWYPFEESVRNAKRPMPRMSGLSADLRENVAH